MSVPTALLTLPPYVVLVRFDPVAGEDRHPTYRLVDDQDRSAMSALFEEVKQNTDLVYIIDLTGKSFCGTMRLGHLIRLQQTLRSTGRILRIAADQKELLDVFRLTRLNSIMCVSNSLTEAIADALRPI